MRSGDCLGPVLLLAATLVVACSGARGIILPAQLRLAPGLEVRALTLARPRPLRLWAVRVDLGDPALEVLALPGPDPDGAGPAEAALTDPLRLAAESQALILINANPWARLDANLSGDWQVGEPVQIAGLVAQDGVIRSQAEPRVPCLWFDQAGLAHAAAELPPGAAPRTGIAGFTLSLRDGQVTGPTGGDLHPRSAIGIADGGRTLWLLVADGREPGVSEGLGMAETAEQLRLLGCSDGIVLDGGGSSVLLVDRGGGPEVVNEPSDGSPRPLPVALVVRRR
jgi:hypothetical protein